MELLLLGNKLLSSEGHSRLVAGELAAGQIPAKDSNIGAYTSGARELMVGLKSPRETLVPNHLILSMELRQLVEQLPTGGLRSSITPGQVGYGLCLVYTLYMAECPEPGAHESAAFVEY